MRLLFVLVLVGCSNRVCTLEEFTQGATPQRIQECQQAKKAVAVEMCGHSPPIIPIPGNPNMSEAAENGLPFAECIEKWGPVLEACREETTTQQKKVCR